uniref:Uncharacterized protein n=1 Tax=Chaetoceros debilis TaxID=122233 RepID=A0A7S3Q3J5_9STRA
MFLSMPLPLMVTLPCPCLLLALLDALVIITAAAVVVNTIKRRAIVDAIAFIFAPRGRFSYALALAAVLAVADAVVGTFLRYKYHCILPSSLRMPLPMLLLAPF